MPRRMSKGIYAKEEVPRNLSQGGCPKEFMPRRMCCANTTGAAKWRRPTHSQLHGIVSIRQRSLRQEEQGVVKGKLTQIVDGASEHIGDDPRVLRGVCYAAVDKDGRLNLNVL